MGTLNPDDQLLGWVADTKEAVLLVCQAHYPSGELPAYPWFLSKARNAKVQSSLAELMYRAHMNCRQFSHHVGEHLGALTNEIESCSLAVATTSADIISAGDEIKKLRKDSADPSNVSMTLTNAEYTFGLMSKGEVFAQPAHLPVSVELDLNSLTVVIHEDNVHELISPKEVLSKLNIEKLRQSIVTIDRHILLKSGRSCNFSLTFYLNDIDRSLVYAEQIRVLEEVGKRTSEKKAQLEEERSEIMKVLGINDQEKKEKSPEQNRGCDRCSLL